MRIVECDRCHKQIKKPEKIGYVALNWRDPRTDELAGSSPTEELDFCDECMDEIANFLAGKTEEPAPEAEKPSKVNVGRIRELAENGKSISDISKETGYSYPTIKKYLGR